jgi:hypothetical protein
MRSYVLLFQCTLNIVTEYTLDKCVAHLFDYAFNTFVYHWSDSIASITVVYSTFINTQIYSLQNQCTACAKWIDSCGLRLCPQSAYGQLVQCRRGVQSNSLTIVRFCTPVIGVWFSDSSQLWDKAKYLLQIVHDSFIIFWNYDIVLNYFMFWKIP